MTVVPRFPLKLNASLTLPTSKSLCARALVINHLCQLPVPLVGLSDCDDTQAILQGLEVLRNSEDAPLRVDIGAAGTAMRFLTALFAATPQLDVVITGSQRMKERPIGALVTALQAAGADISYVEKEGYPPLRIRGKQLEGGTLSLPSNISSQYVSALLMIAPTMRRGLQLELVGKVASAPYIRMTMQVMKAFGVEVKWEKNVISVVRGQRYARTLSSHCGTTKETEQAASYTIECDWTAASYWYEIVALHPDKATRVLLRGLRQASEQGDAVCAKWFEALGVTTTFTAEGAILEKSTKSPQVTLECDNSTSEDNELSSQTDDNFCESNEDLPQTTSHSSQADYFSCKDATPLWLDFAAAPDLAQTFVVTCALLSHPFHFKGLESLRIKETDRIEALKKEMAKLGFVLREMAEGELSWDGMRCRPTGEAIDTYEDHRMALAFAPVALVNKEIKINQPDVVSKSYPQFWNDLIQSGFEINET